MTDFRVMKAPTKLPNVTELKYPRLVQPKFDGIRGTYVPGEGLLSGSGKKLPNKNLMKYFYNLENTSEYVLEGEIFSFNRDFEEIKSIVMSHGKTIPPDLKFLPFDCISFDFWQIQHCPTEYEQRLQSLRVLLNSVIADPRKILDMRTDEVGDCGDLVNLYKMYLKEGLEGIMIWDPKGKYKWGRATLKSAEVLKLKPVKTVDLKMIGVYEGKGKYEGKVGGLIADFNGNAIRVGTGIDDVLREALSRKPNDYIGKTVEIKYFEETKEGVLRQPRFIRIRDDKDM